MGQWQLYVRSQRVRTAPAPPQLRLPRLALGRLDQRTLAPIQCTQSDPAADLGID
jgi:hypothetical protein